MQIYTLHIFFLNKNMYIFIWGEGSIKISEPGEYYHTHTCIYLHAQKSHSELFARETNSYERPSNPCSLRKAEALLVWPSRA